LYIVNSNGIVFVKMQAKDAGPVLLNPKPSRFGIETGSGKSVAANLTWND
jgi:hypothetical protein